jgi:hypothetical protein
MIVHLNDAHEWTREQIASWLEENGAKQNGTAASRGTPSTT